MTQKINQFFQGDVWIMRLPDSVKPIRDKEISPVNGKLILQEGEMTGHHHAIDVMDRTTGRDIDDLKKDSKLGAIFSKGSAPTAKMFRGASMAQELVKKGVLLRADLVVGLLEIENGPMSVTHQEHSPIMLAPGCYVVGRQIESVFGEERRIAD